MAIRITDNPEPGAIARRLGLCRSLLCAAPRWLRAAWPAGDASTICNSITVLLYSHFAGQRWQFSDAQGQEASVAVSGNLSAGISSRCWRRRSPGAALRCSPNWRRERGWPAGRWRWCSLTGRRRRWSVYGIYLSATISPMGYRCFWMRCSGDAGEIAAGA